MTAKQVEQKFQEILYAVCEIDSSDAFKKMLESNNFPVDDNDMGYLIHQVESMLGAVNAFVKTNA